MLTNILRSKIIYSVSIALFILKLMIVNLYKVVSHNQYNFNYLNLQITHICQKKKSKIIQVLYSNVQNWNRQNYTNFKFGRKRIIRDLREYSNFLIITFDNAIPILNHCLPLVKTILWPDIGTMLVNNLSQCQIKREKTRDWTLLCSQLFADRVSDRCVGFRSGSRVFPVLLGSRRRRRALTKIEPAGTMRSSRRKRPMEERNKERRNADYRRS